MKSVMAKAICPFVDPLQCSSKAITFDHIALKWVPHEKTKSKKKAIVHIATNINKLVLNTENQWRG